MRKLNPQALNQLLTQIVTSINTMHTQNIWLLGLTSTWAHNRLVLWAFGFPSVRGPMLGKPKYTSISSRLSLFLTEPLICSLRVFALFSQYSSQNCQPLFLILSSYLQARMSGGVMITSPSQCEWRSNSIISKWTFRRKGGSGIGIDCYFHRLLGSDVVKCMAEQLGTGHLRARTLPSRSKMIFGGGRGCLRCINEVLFRVPGPKLGLEVSGPRLKVQVWGRLYDVLWGLSLRNTGSRAQALYRGPNSHTHTYINNSLCIYLTN